MNRRLFDVFVIAAAVFFPSIASADTYPAESGYTTGGTFFASTKAASCQLWMIADGSCGTFGCGGLDRHYDADDVHCGFSYTIGGAGSHVGEVTSAFCHRTGACNVFAGAIRCPHGGTLFGSNCVSAPSCPSPQERDPETGQCGLVKPKKNLGDCGPQCTGVGNPLNAGTATKLQVETLFSSGSNTPLIERLTYNSRLLVDVDSVLTSSQGKGWRGHYGRSLAVLSTGVVMAQRGDGKHLDFAPPVSGTVYVANADVADRLERLVDGSGNTTGWKYTAAANDSTELYNATDRLLSITDRAGNTLTMTYSDASTPPSIAPAPGFLIRVADAWGRAIEYTYTAQSRLNRITDPAGGTYDFVRDANDNLVSITFPDTKVKEFRYNEQEHTQNTALPYSLTGIIDENGDRFATFKYDTQGRAVSSEHAGAAQKVTLEYPSPLVSTTVTDAFGVGRTYGLTTSLGVVRRTGVTGAPCPSCGPASLTYDANGNLASRTDWNGNRTNYAYDLARNLETSRTEALTSGGVVTPQTRTITTAWHATFRLPTQIAEPLRITTNVYDADGTQCGARGALCSRSVQATTDASGAQEFSATASGSPRTWTYTYNANGNVLTVNGPRTDVSDITTYTYYANDDTDLAKRGNVATIANAHGHTTSITSYNAHGQPLAIVDPNSLTTTLTYDERQRLKTRTVGGELTTYDYDFAGQLKKVTLPDGSFLSYTYDDAHRLTGIEDNLGNRIDYTVDLMGNRTLEQVRDPANALAQTRSRVYSNLNRLFQELGATSQTTEYTYDDQGNVLTVKDPLNRVTTNQYDALNRLKQVTSPTPISAVTQYAYNGLDALTKVTDPRSLETGYAVDGLGNLNVQTSPDTGTTTNEHDAAGNLIKQTDAKSQETTYAYDAINRVTLITFHDGSKQTYAYDQGANGIGRLSSITEANPANQVTSVFAYAYDQHGRVLSETRTVNGVQYVLGYRYDAFGRLDQLTYPSTRTVNYTFDALGRVSGVTTTKAGDPQQTVVSNVTYHPFGGVKAYTLGNGRAYTRGIDLDGRIQSYTLGGTEFTLGYDNASRILFITQTNNPPNLANLNTYGYDNLDRLTSASLPGGTEYGYGYDAVGNRVNRNSDIYAYSATSNRLDKITPASGPVRNFAFDDNGSTTADGVNTYVYDVRGRMVQATSSIGVTTYQINALGQRIRKTNSQTDRVFHYDTKGRLIAETDPGGGLKRELLYLGDIPVGVVQ
jgi:YD repeat-containing protein